jgi:AcrR family transcriptional regulator
MAQADDAGLGRRERRKREVHDRILEAAVALFDADGVEATKVADICQRADVAHKTFFNHFPTKQHLLREIAEQFLNLLFAQLEQARKSRGSTPTRVARFFEQVGINAERAGPMHRELVMEIIELAHSDRTEPDQTRRLHEAFGALIGDGVEAGDVTRRHEVEALTELALGAFYAVMLNWVSLEGYAVRERATAAGLLLRDAIRKR